VATSSSPDRETTCVSPTSVRLRENMVASRPCLAIRRAGHYRTTAHPDRAAVATSVERGFGHENLFCPLFHSRAPKRR
jgi:hypothetical protein